MPTAVWPSDRARTANRTNDSTLPAMSLSARTTVLRMARAPAAWAAWLLSVASVIALDHRARHAAGPAGEQPRHRSGATGPDAVVVAEDLEREAREAVLAGDQRAGQLEGLP